MIIVGICGASGSGKSTLAKEIEDSLTCTSAIIGLDCYYRDHSDLPFEERVHINYDEPDIFDFDQLYADIQRLQGGLPITRKGYDYARHMRADSDELIQPMDVLILEGIHMFRDKRITDLMSLKVYMHVDIDVCLLRRIKRDIRVRGRSIENIAEQYMATVKPMYEEYISKIHSGGRLCRNAGRQEPHGDGRHFRLHLRQAARGKIRPRGEAGGSQKISFGGFH